MEDNHNVENQFNDNADKSLEMLRRAALVTCFPHFMIRSPSPKVYERFAKDVDAYVEAFKKKYNSLQEYIDDEEAKLLPLLAQKGISQSGPVLDIEDGLKAKIAKINEQVYTPNAYLNRDDFAQYFIIDIPGAFEKVVEFLNAKPDAPVPAAPAAKGPAIPKS